MPSVKIESNGDPIVVEFTTEEWHSLIRAATEAECTVEELLLRRLKEALAQSVSG